MRLKRKHKKAIAIAAIAFGFVLFCAGVYWNQTVPPELSMDHPEWFARAEERSDQEFRSFVCMGIGGFAIIVAIEELLRQARKLKV